MKYHHHYIIAISMIKISKKFLGKEVGQKKAKLKKCEKRNK